MRFQGDVTLKAFDVASDTRRLLGNPRPVTFGEFQPKAGERCSAEVLNLDAAGDGISRGVVPLCHIRRNNSNRLAMDHKRTDVGNILRRLR